MESMELQSCNKSRKTNNPETEMPDSADRDETELIRLGKKPVLKRNFGFMSILGFSCTVLITWEGILVYVEGVYTKPSQVCQQNSMLFATQLIFVSGGPAGVIWGFVIVWVGTLSTFAVIAELVSMAPTAGGQYHWVAILAPQTYRRFFSYITGWMTYAGWQAYTASSAYLIGTLLQSVIALTDSKYTPQPWQALLLMWAVLFFSIFINTVASRALAAFEGMILVLHILGFFCVLVPLVYLGPHGDSSIFTTFLNQGGWSSQGLSFMVGLPSSVFSLIGADSAAHMSEEIKSASTTVPRAILFSILINGSLGFAMLVAYLFCLGDLGAALAAQKTLGYPFIEVFYQATGSVPGSAIMCLIVITLGVCSAVGALASSSRMLWSFSRDRGVPLWKLFIKLHPRTTIPIYAIAVTTTITVLLSLIILGSSVVFSDIVNLTVVGLYSSYLLCCALLLWRRCIPGQIQPHRQDSPQQVVGPGNLRWGPWRIPGILGVVNNVFACIYLVLLWFWSFWPPATPVSPSSMNFSVLIWGVTVLFAVLWYWVHGRNEYEGPIIEVDLRSE